MILSIIIPVYNVEAYLPDCLDSVFSQDLTDCEVIAVNDGSTDKSSQILAEYKNKYLCFKVLEQLNKGASAARNLGISASSGTYLYFLDSDDYLQSGAIDLIKHSIKNAPTDLIAYNALINGETLFYSSFKVSNSIKTGIEYFEDFFDNNFIYPHVNPWLYVYKSNFIVDNKLFFKESLYHEDLHFSMLVFFYASTVSCVNSSICNYRQYRAGSLSMNIKLKNLTDRSKICRELNEFFERNNFENKHFYNVLFQQYLYNINLAVTNNFLAAKKQYFRSDDKAIMKKGITNDYEYKLWVLARLNFELLDNYANNRLSVMQRKLINIIGSFLYK
jgi:Glycosyltransferases involved in cell wall biogenesis